MAQCILYRGCKRARAHSAKTLLGPDGGGGGVKGGRAVSVGVMVPAEQQQQWLAAQLAFGASKPVKEQLLASQATQLSMKPVRGAVPMGQLVGCTGVPLGQDVRVMLDCGQLPLEHAVGTTPKSLQLRPAWPSLAELQDLSSAQLEMAKRSSTLTLVWPAGARTRAQSSAASVQTFESSSRTYGAILPMKLRARGRGAGLGGEGSGGEGCCG